MSYKDVRAFLNSAIVEPPRVSYEDKVDLCPVCNKQGTPIQRGACQTNSTSPKKLWVFFQCPARTCHSAFISEFDESYNLNFDFRRSFPYSFTGASFPEEVSSVSPLFPTIYNQALKAEMTGLEHVAGPGYRKALEFLVKDYAIARNPDKTEKIKSTHLMPCINEYIDDAKVRKMAALATWLGNDETHYLRKWDGKDVQNLKHLIRLTTMFIEAEIAAEAYIKEMAPESK